MEVQVEKIDIKRIGHIAYNENGNLNIICNGDTYNLEVILLRNILKCFGDGFKITNEEDYVGYEGNDILIATNLPFDLYNEIE